MTNSRKKIKQVVHALVFVVITKEGMKVFRTKENFLFNKKPLHEVRFALIKTCGVVGEEEDEKEEVKYKTGKKAFYVDIEKNNENDNSDMKDEGKSPSKSVSGEWEEERVRKGKKMKLIEPKKKELNVVKRKKGTDIQGGVLPNRIVFASHSKDTVHKWVCVINHFISGH